MGSIQNIELAKLLIEYLAIICFNRNVNSFNFAYLMG